MTPVNHRPSDNFVSLLNLSRIMGNTLGTENPISVIQFDVSHHPTRTLRRKPDLAGGSA